MTLSAAVAIVVEEVGWKWVDAGGVFRSGLLDAVRMAERSQVANLTVFIVDYKCIYIFVYIYIYIYIIIGAIVDEFCVCFALLTRYGDRLMHSIGSSRRVAARVARRASVADPSLQFPSQINSNFKFCIEVREL